MTGPKAQSVRAQEVQPAPSEDAEGLRGRRAAFWVFVVAQGLIFVALFWNYHGRWFIADEWEFLAARTAGNLDSLFRPYHEHWSTLPILYYRLLWNLVGIRSYEPYLVSILVLHLSVSGLLRSVMRRADVLPWIATLCALIFSLYGAGNADISYAFNIGFDGSVFFGLLYLMAVDHAGPAGRRDLLGMGAGVAALMCSGIGVAMVIVVGIAVWIRHGLRRALMVTAPLAVVYLIWFAAIGSGAYSRHSSLAGLLRFAALGVSFTFSSLGHSPVVGALLALLLVSGLVVAFRSSEPGVLRARYGAPAALLVGAVVFMAITGYGRATGSLPSSDTYAASRYLYVVAAMLLPAIAVAASQLISARPRIWPVVVFVLVLGIPGNIAVVHRSNYLHTLDGYRQFFLSLPRLPIAARLPRDLHPDPYYDSQVTMGWLLDGVRSGRIPAPSPPPSEGQVAYWTLRLAWSPAAPARPATCRLLPLPTSTHVEAGSRLTIGAPVEVSSVYAPGRESTTIQLGRTGRSATYRSVWPMEVRITPTSPGQSASLCGGRS